MSHNEKYNKGYRWNNNRRRLDKEKVRQKESANRFSENIWDHMNKK